MSSQISNNTYNRADLLKKRAAAQKALEIGEGLTVEQRRQLLKVIRYVDITLADDYTSISENDVPSKGLNILSFLFPFIGLILYCVFSDSKPNKAHSVGKWALIGFCTGIGLSVLSYLLGILLLF